MAAPLTDADYIAGVRAGDRRLLAKAITLIESARLDHAEQARRVVEALLPADKSAYRLGVSGPPGVGKSSFIEAFGSFLTAQGLKVAVLAVDPSSRRSGGSILGDKTRMTRLSADPLAYIRPSPSGETLGGVARKTREATLLLEAAGFDWVVVETVGVGQSETMVAGMVDCFLLLAQPHAGDDLQGIKRGIVELADAIVVNKADGALLAAAQEAAHTWQQALGLLHSHAAVWMPPVLLASSLNNQGLDGVFDALLSFRLKMDAQGAWEEKRRRQALNWMWELLDDALKRQFIHHPAVNRQLDQLTRAVTGGTLSPVDAATRLLTAYGQE